MTLQKLSSMVAKREGKKSQARVGDIREILKIICMIEAEMMCAVEELSDMPTSAIRARANVFADKLMKGK